MFSIILILTILFFPRPIFSAPPISGTFIVPDLSFKSELDYRTYFQELKDTGINMVIFTLTDNLDKNCSTGSYNETHNLKTIFSGSNQPFFPTATKIAKEMGFQIYFSIANHTALYSCFTYHQGSASNESSDKGRLISSSLRTIDEIKKMVLGQGISWEDPSIIGFYLSPEESTQILSVENELYGTVYPQLSFYKDLSLAIKQKEPSKKILLSPFQLEETDYDTSLKAFTNIFRLTNIDIIAPQDSLGTNVTRSFTASANHYRALKNAVSQFPSKEGWVNIEAFGSGPNGDTFVNISPAEFSRVEQQITAATPYTNKFIMWIYQYTMLSNPRFDNLASTNKYAPQYTPQNSVLRKKLRQDYLSKYGSPNALSANNNCQKLFYFNTTTKKCLATNDSYDINQKNCTNSQNSCSQNLSIYLPGKTNGICYSTLLECNNTHSTITPSPTIYTHTTTSTSPNRTSTYTRQSGDANSDGVVDIADYTIWYKEFFDQKGHLSDFSGELGTPDNKVDIYDYSVWYSEFSRPI